MYKHLYIYIYVVSFCISMHPEFNSHRIHGTGIFTYMYHKHQPICMQIYHTFGGVTYTSKTLRQDVKKLKQFPSTFAGRNLTSFTGKGKSTLSIQKDSICIVYPNPKGSMYGIFTCIRLICTVKPR